MASSSSQTIFGMKKETAYDVFGYTVILLAIVAFFADALFGGKNFMSEGDNVAFYSFIPYLDAAKESGEFPLWMPYIFSGMPSLASFLAAGERWWDIVGRLLFMIPRGIGDVFNNDTARLAMWYAIYGWGVYTLMRVKGHERTIGVFSGLAAVFSTWVIIWVMIGHSTKPVSMATLPWILLALERLRERFTPGNLFLLVLPLIVLVTATHPQMMFYIGCATALYMIVELAARVITNDGWMNVLRTAGGLALAAMIALGTHADMFLATREYTPESTRGSAPLLQAETADQSGGNDYEYATNWSFSPEEMHTFLIPNYFGFGNTSIKVAGREQRANLYWGQMPFTDAAHYMGVGVLLLAFIGAWGFRRDPFVIFLIALSLFSLLLSFGKNAPILYDVFYNHAPAFNKFRAPNIALCLLEFAVPVLAGYGIARVAQWRKESPANIKRNGLIALGGAAVVAAYMFLLSTDSFDYKKLVNDALVAKQGDASQGVSQQFLDIVYSEMKSDATASALILVAFGALVFLTARGTLKPRLGVPIFIVLMLVDLWRVDKRPYEPRKGSPEKNVFTRTDVVDFIKSDEGVYRIADLSRNSTANWWAYHFIENVHGYSSAKLRVYQDKLDLAAPGPGRDAVAGNSAIFNPFLWNMLNVKYLVASQQLYSGVEPNFSSASTGQLVYKNPTAMPRAWFVDTVLVETNSRTMLEKLRDGTFDLSTTAYVDKDFSGRTNTAADSSASVRVTARGNQNISFATKTSAPKFLVVSEVYYDEWHAYVDGNEVPIHKTNFLIRGIQVPAGSHTVEFRYESPAFEQGRTISIASNAAAILIGLAGFGMWWRRRKSIA